MILKGKKNVNNITQKKRTPINLTFFLFKSKHGITVKDSNQARKFMDTKKKKINNQKPENQEMKKKREIREGVFRLCE